MELLTVYETARMLRVTPITVRRYIASGHLPAVKVGKGVRVRKEAVDKLVIPVEPKPTKAKQALSVGRPLAYDDVLWKLVGSATLAQPTDASKKHEYEAEELARQLP